MDQILTRVTRKAGDGLLSEVLALKPPGIFLSLTGPNFKKVKGYCAIAEVFKRHLTGPG